LRLPTDRNPDSQTADAGRSDDAGGGDDVDSANEANKKKRHIQPPTLRCSPAKWLDIVKTLPKGVVVICLEGMLQLNYCRFVICSSLSPCVLILFSQFLF
jgi:hypothetical protein